MIYSKKGVCFEGAQWRSTGVAKGSPKRGNAVFPPIATTLVASGSETTIGVAMKRIQADKRKHYELFSNANSGSFPFKKNETFVPMLLRRKNR